MAMGLKSSSGSLYASTPFFTFIYQGYKDRHAHLIYFFFFLGGGSYTEIPPNNFSIKQEKVVKNCWEKIKQSCKADVKINTAMNLENIGRLRFALIFSSWFLPIVKCSIALLVFCQDIPLTSLTNTLFWWILWTIQVVVCNFIWTSLISQWLLVNIFKSLSHT